MFYARRPGYNNRTATCSSRSLSMSAVRILAIAILVLPVVSDSRRTPAADASDPPRTPAADAGRLAERMQHEGWLAALKTLAQDDHPRVRLMAEWAASFLQVPEAAEVVFIAKEKPTDQYLEHLMNETMRAIDPLIAKALAE
jgi:hypothetical protein